LAARAATLFALLALVMIVFWLDRDGLRDFADGHVSFADVVYFTMVTVTTVGYGDIVPVTVSARLFDALLVTPVRLLVWLIFIGTAYQFVVERILEDTRMRLRQSRLKDHIVICGFGRSGRSAAAEFAKRGVAPSNVVVIEESESALEEAADAGYLGLRGDAAREGILTEACVDRAQSVLLCLGRDDTAVLTALTIRHLSPTVRIIASVREQENEKLLLQSGANAIVSPSVIAGALLANSTDSSQIVDYIRDLISAGGRITLERREADERDIGKRPGEIRDGLLLRIHRGSATIGFWEPEAVVREGDVLLVVTPQQKTL
jgi:voltage-gated potassium channel